MMEVMEVTRFRIPDVGFRMSIRIPEPATVHTALHSSLAPGAKEEEWTLAFVITGWGGYRVMTTKKGWS